MKQINNLKIKRYADGMWRVIAPDGRVLEEFHTKMGACTCARNIFDFLSPQKRVEKTLRRMSESLKI